MDRSVREARASAMRSGRPGLRGLVDRRVAHIWAGRLPDDVQRHVSSMLLWTLVLPFMAVVQVIFVTLFLIGVLPSWVPAPEWATLVLVLVVSLSMRARAARRARRALAHSLNLPPDATRRIQFTADVAKFDQAISVIRSGD